ncbi:ABC-three component system middle component 2 [Stenotrophomonas sp. NPDC078853]|uniref:ABC-three component system middle component 2 n=1 Tax=Stenotrophomonas sp. NPDC078853 TaxID=3364534 RepID=UPI00384E2CFF
MKSSSQVFNTPFELGIRVVYLLHALHPRKPDLQTLLYLDYAVIYSADVGGPESLHTPVPLRGVEYASRREAIQSGLFLMASRAFIDATATSEGIRYGIGESGPALIDLLDGAYIRALRERCAWVARELGHWSDDDLEALLGARGSLWKAHFISTDGP